MPRSFSRAESSTPLNSLDGVRPRDVGEQLKCQPRSIELTGPVKDALIRHYGTLKAAAISMGEMDEGQLNREIKSGDFKLLKRLRDDPAALAAVADSIREAVGPTDPRAQARRLIREARARLDELDEVVNG